MDKVADWQPSREGSSIVRERQNTYHTTIQRFAAAPIMETHHGIQKGRANIQPETIHHANNSVACLHTRSSTT
jgi:hypothetical protein